MVPKFQALGIDGGTIKEKYGGAGFTNLEHGAISYELAKIDSGIATFYNVHNAIGLNVINTLGDEEQKMRMLPSAMNFKKIACFGLTEPTNGSDASNLTTTATKTEGGYLINGRKRWIGNALTATYINVWARNPAEGNKVQCFVVMGGSKGLKLSKIKNKYSMRLVQNADIEFDNVFVPDNNRLTHGKDFASGTAAMLESSRLQVAWMGAGVAAGAYEAALKYCLQRH